MKKVISYIVYVFLFLSLIPLVILCSAPYIYTILLMVIGKFCKKAVNDVSLPKWLDWTKDYVEIIIGN